MRSNSQFMSRMLAMGLGTLLSVTPVWANNSTARAINNKGQIVGVSQAPNSGEEHAFLYRDGKMTDLSTLGGGGSTAYGINDAGQVVGNTGDVNNSSIGFLYNASNDKMTPVYPPPGPNPTAFNSPQGTAYGINSGGQIVGEWFYGNMMGTYDPFRAYLDSAGQYADLGTFGGSGSTAYAINDRGDTVGKADFPLPPPSIPSFGDTNDRPTWRAFLYKEGKMIDLLGEDYSIAYDINNSGQVVGQNAKGHAFLYSDGKATDLGTLSEGETSIAYGVNNAGQVVGYSYGYDANAFPAGRAFLYQNGKMTDIGGLGGNNTIAYDINDSGQIVGSSRTADSQTHAFLYSDGKMTDLVGLQPADVRIRGDLNDDFNVTVADAVLALRLLVGLDSPNAFQSSVSDVDRNGTFTLKDVQYILQRAVASAPLS